MAGQKNRTQLQALFKSGAKPSEENFQDFINSVLNINDDGLEKPSGVDSPLKILAHGETENLLDFYAGDLQSWRLNQKPTGANPGFNLETGGISKLFVESSTGNLGLNTTQPTAKLHIQQSGSQDALRIDDEASDSTPLIVDSEGKVGIGKKIPTKLLDVNGEVAIAGPLSVTQTSALKGNVGIGTAPGKGALKLTVAGDTAISGALSVTQTSRLNGNVGIGTAPGAEKLKVGGALSVTQESALTGNVGIGVGADPAHKLTVYGGELALKVDSNEKAQSILFQNSGGAYTWRIYRQNVGDSKADLKIAGGLGNQTDLIDYIHIQNNGNTKISGNLSITGTGISSLAGTFTVVGDVKADGSLYAGGNPLAYENYEIYLRGAATESAEGDTPTLKIANVSISMNTTRGLNTVILNPNGAFKKKISHDVYGNASRWNTWADWLKVNAADGDIIAVASRDAIRNAPTGGSAEKLLRQIVALKAFRSVQGHARSPYALLFVQGITGAIEVSQPYKGDNAHLKTTYYQLLNYGKSAVMVGMIVMWSGAVADIPFGWTLCDGENSTPDLRDRFIVAAGSNTYDPGDSGNPDTHAHKVDPPSTTLTIDSAGAHTHKFPGDWYKRDFSNGNKSGIDTSGDDVKKKATESSGSHTHTGKVNIAQFNSSSNSGLNRPKWYALCFIMKL